MQEEAKNRVIELLCNTDQLNALQIPPENHQSYIDRCEEIVIEDITWTHDNGSDQAQLMVFSYSKYGMVWLIVDKNKSRSLV